MTFKETLVQVVEWLQQDGRVSYRALKRQFDFDEDGLDDLKEALFYAHAKTIIDDGRGLVWNAESLAMPLSAHRDAASENRFQTLLRGVTGLLQGEQRVTYRTLKHLLGIDDSVLVEIREELRLRHLAADEEGKVLVWTGGTQSAVASSLADPSQLALIGAAPHPASAPVSARPAQISSPDARFNGPPPSETRATDVLPDLPMATPESVRSVPDAERRQLTVMFCDLVGSTDLSGRLDPEDLRVVVRAYQETAAEVIQRYEGHIAQYLGDGLLIYFGFPVAHEDDAQRAVYTGLEIPEAIAALNTRLETDFGVQLSVRIGIHTGPVVVGEMGGGGRHENLALGETPNIAARLESLAPPNTAIVSLLTAQLVQRSFVLRELGLHELKGVAEPLMLYAVVAPSESESDDHETMLTSGFDALVGRDEEIGLLLRRWEQSKEGLGQVVLLSGEAGIGKSSLVEGLRRHVRQEGMTRITFRCSPYHINSAFYPIIEHVQRTLDWQPGDTVETQLRKLEQGLEDTSLPLEESIPFLAVLLSLSLPEDRYPAPTLTPQQLRQQTQDVLVAWMLEDAERQPLLAVWEDLHWADPSTLELLGLFIEQAATVPMMNVLAYRPEFVPPWSTQLHLTPISLNRLERAHIEVLVQRLAGGKPLPAEVEQHIVSKTDGVPLYVEELTKMLLESDLLAEETEQYVLTGPLSSASIPATLQDSLMARLDRLPTVKKVAQLGAVFGREFTYEMLQGLSAVEEPALQEGLGQLVDTELLYQRGRIPRAKYIFRHALIRDAAYQSLLRRTRQRYHEQVAKLLETRFPEMVEIQPELVAHHYTEASCTEPAIAYWQRAGDTLSQRSANLEAASHLTKGLELLGILPTTPERLQQELDLQVSLGSVLMVTKGFADPNVERAYTRAQELCQQIGDTPQLFPVLRGLMSFYITKGQLQEAHRLGEELLRLAEAQPETEHLLLTHHQMGTVLFLRGESASAQAHHTQAVAIYTTQEHRDLAVRYGIDLGVGSYCFLSLELWQLGYPDQALQHCQEARTLAKDVSHPYSLAAALLWAAYLHQFRREAAAAHEQAAAATTLTTEHGFSLYAACGKVLDGWALSIQGQGEQGMGEIRQGLSAERATGAKLWQPYFLGLLAEAYGESGHPEEGLPLLAEALAVVDTTEERFYEAELYRLKGVLLLRQAVPDASQAEACFHQALNVSRHQQAKSLELRAATSLARLWQQQGKRHEARELLAPVYGWFTEGFDTADLIEAKSLLEAKEASPCQ